MPAKPISSLKDIQAVYVDSKGRRPTRYTLWNWRQHKGFPAFPTSKARIDAFLVKIRSPYAPGARHGRRSRSDLDEIEQVERILRLRAQRKIEQIHARVAQGKLIDASDVMNQFSRAGHAVQVALRAIPRSIAGDLLGIDDPAEVEAIIQRAVDDVFNEHLIFDIH